MRTVQRNVTLRYVADEEIEFPALTQFLSGDDGAPPPWTGTALSEGQVAEQRLDATYFDTQDLRLAASGLTLRRRTGGNDAGWHLEMPPGTHAGSKVRLPPGRLPPGRTPRTVPTELQNMVWARSLGAPLHPVARISTMRTVRRLTDATGHVLLELADDRVTARRLLLQDGPGEAAGAPTSWREIEVQLADGDSDLCDQLDTRLRAQGLQTAPAAYELTRVLGAEDDARQQPAADDACLTVKSTAGEVLLTHIRQQVAQVQAQDLPVRLDAPDSVHKMRVATRRLRSALRTFKPLFDGDVVRPLRAELKWLAGELGAARDAEVMRDRVRSAVAEQSHDPAVRGGAEDTQAELTAAYRTAHDRVLAELDSDRYHRILEMLHALAEQPPFTKRASAPAGKVLPRLVARSYQRLAQLVQEAGSRPSGSERDELLHDARKAAKQARYAGETVAPAIGKDATAFAQAMEAVQEALGEHQDSVLTRERLHHLARQASSTEVAFLYGRLYAQEEARAEQSQQRFDAAWTDAGHKSLHRWLR